MIDYSQLNLDISNEKEDSKSRRIIKHIYAIRNYFADNEVKIDSIFMNKKLIRYITKYNFISIRKQIDDDKLEDLDILGYLQEMKIVYRERINEDELSFNTENETGLLKIKIKF